MPFLLPNEQFKSTYEGTHNTLLVGLVTIKMVNS